MSANTEQPPHVNDNKSAAPTVDAPRPQRATTKRTKKKEQVVKREHATVAPDLEKIVAALAGGDLTIDASSVNEDSFSGARHELNSLARNMRRTIGSLQRAADQIETISESVLEGGRVLALGVADEAASVDATVSSIAEITASAGAVAEAVGALSNLAQTTSTSSLEMAASIDEVSTNADTLAAFVEETASAIEEMAASVASVAQSSKSLTKATDEAERSMRSIDDSTQQVGAAVTETAVLAEEMQRSAEEGARVVHETAASVRATQLGIEQAAETVVALGRNSERIGQITKVIDGIAERTNLLALNARILAAQAGQQGRGFAVVAEEIKELSERTARSTEEIEELIASVRDSVRAAEAQAVSNRQLSDEGVRLAEQAANSLHEISRKSEQSAKSVRQIADAATVQALESHQVTELVAQVRTRSEEIERATGEQARTAQEVGERAVHMSELTGQVRRAMQEQAEASKHIAEAMEQLTDVVQQIGGATGEQHRGAEEVLRAAEVIREAVKRNQASIVRINYTTGLLDYEATSLRDSVKTFRLPVPERGGEIVYAEAARFPTLDYLENTTVVGGNVLSQVLECLVDTGEGAEVVPSLAESWEIASDGRSYVFNLRPDVRFHNGREITASDVIYSIRRTLRESYNGAWVYANLVGAREFASGESEDLAGARVIDAHTVELELVEPLALFLHILCLRYAAIVPREEIETDGGARFRRMPVGTGAFRLLKTDEAKATVELERFAGYWKRDEPRVERVSIKFNEDGDQLANEMHEGKLSFLNESSAQRVRRFTEDAAWRSCVVFAPQLHTQFLFFNSEQPPFADVRVRRAVVHAIDRERLVREGYGEIAVPATGPIPPMLIGHDASYRGLEYDPAHARKLLAEAGHANGFKINLWRSHTEQRASAKAGEIICEQLAAIGIECEINVVDVVELVKAARDGRAQIGDISWHADYADADNFTYALFHSATRRYGCTATSPDIDRLSVLARRTINHAERARLYTELHHLIAEEAVCAFLTHRRIAVIHRPEVEGLRTHLVAPNVRPQDLWLKKSGAQVSGVGFQVSDKN